MIQRIQSIYLLLAGLASAIGFCVNSAEWTLRSNLIGYLRYCAVVDTTGQTFSHPWGLIVFGTLAVALPLVAIFCYTNRKRQMRMVRATQLFSLLIYPTLYAYTLAADKFFCYPDETVPSFPEHIPAAGIVFPLLAIVFAQLAYRAIRKDENLIRSADRIR